MKDLFDLDFSYDDFCEIIKNNQIDLFEFCNLENIVDVEEIYRDVFGSLSD